MSIRAITTSAKDVAKSVLNGGTSVAKWSINKVGDLGGFLKDKAAVITTWVKGFFQNLPQYFSSTKTHLSAFVQHIKNNKANSAGIAGLAAFITLGALAIFKHLSKEAV